MYFASCCDSPLLIMFLKQLTLTIRFFIFREFLIKSCWNLEFKKRPQASEIVEFLANNPRLLSPCLDVPLSSVEFEDTGQLELNLPTNLRKFSVTLTSQTEGNEIRQRSLSHDSEPSPSLPDVDETNPFFFPNGSASQNVDWPRVPLLSSHRGGPSPTVVSSSGFGKLVTIHRSESCDEFGNQDQDQEQEQEHETSVL